MSRDHVEIERRVTPPELFFDLVFALGYRKFKTLEELTQLLAERCTVINYGGPVRPDQLRRGP